MLRRLKWRIKKWLKESQIWNNFFHKSLFLYLKIVYVTSRWHYIHQNATQGDFQKHKNTIYVLWHNRLTFGLEIFKNHKHIYPLVSPHSDGKIISTIIRNFGFDIIEGSSNKNSVGSLKKIIAKLNAGANIVITPDGPRGPVYHVNNSAITELARRHRANLIPISCMSSNFFSLSSWDKMMMPLPFGNIYVIIGSPLILLNNKQINDNNLVDRLNILSKLAEDNVRNR